MKSFLRKTARGAKNCTSSPYFFPALAFVFFCLTESTIYADSTTDLSQMDTLTKSTIEMIFAPWVRKTALAFGTGLGLFKSYTGGSVMPLLSYGGLGLVVNFVPSLIEVITKVGS
ncbi:MAG: hypothetical protein SNF33_00065 (plasmid) [Candidatus Algichlamydia australiensis]|nr:hypothetical protein [Chlamydiales bacterium]